jgi:hypothetical protein
MENAARINARSFDAQKLGGLSARPGSSFFVALLDVAVILAYLISLPVASWYAATLCIKVFLFLFTMSRSGHGRAAAPLALGVLLSVAVSALANGGGQEAGVLRGVGFCLHVFLSVRLATALGLETYLRSVALLVAASALLHTVLCTLGAVQTVYGRYTYFGGSAANLGGEINAIGAIAAGLALRRGAFILVLVALVISTAMLQSRSALMVIAFIFAVRGIVDQTGKFRLDGWRLFAVALFLGCALLAALAYSDVLFQRLSEIFRLDDPQRGLGTGFVGRSDRWVLGQRLFLESPLFGKGIGYVEASGLPSPHNIFWWVAAELGALGLLAVFGPLAVAVYQISTRRPGYAAILTASLPLLVFNDRSLNLNPYPFVLYVAVIGLSATLPTAARVDLTTDRPSTPERLSDRRTARRQVGPSR